LFLSARWGGEVRRGGGNTDAYPPSGAGPFLSALKGGEEPYSICTLHPLKRGAMRVDDFDFDLPKALIADRPVAPRDAARLLVVGEHLEDRRIS
jgi:Queuosine biosynthesis protein